MNPAIHREMLWLAGGVAGVLAAATVTGDVLRRMASGTGAVATIANLNARIRAWWLMSALFAVALFAGGTASVILFGLTSFLALREFVTLIPTRRSDHRALLLAFFVVTPLQYLLVARGWYALFTVMIPVYAFLLLPFVSATRADSERFLERTAGVQWALMVCVYNISYVPALLMLDLPGYGGHNAQLLLVFIVVVQASDVLQYIWGKLLGRHRIAPTISPNKTWEGLAGGVACATAIGAALWWATPFNPWQAAALALLLTLMGFAGGLILSAVKRDRGVKDYGTLIEGHGGVLDRIDSLCFAAPVFFHLTRYFFG